MELIDILIGTAGMVVFAGLLHGFSATVGWFFREEEA